MPAAFDAYFENMDETLLSVMGEQCTYLPKGGESRTVVGAVEEDAMIEDGPAVMENRRVLHVLVMRDPDNADYGGIQKPVFGDGIKREDGDDVFSYTGIRREVSTTAWVLTFTTNEPVIRGGGWRK